MASIVSVKRIARSPGKITADGFELSPRWIVFFDDIIDEATAVYLCRAHTDFPKPGLSTIGNALCNALLATPLSESRYGWEVTAEFDNRGGNNSGDPNAPFLNTDPETPPTHGTIDEGNWQTTLSRSPRPIGRPASKAYYHGGYPSGGVAHGILSATPTEKKPLVNSAGQHLVDAPEDFYYQGLYTIRCYTTEVVELALNYEGSLNDRNLVMAVRTFSFNIPKHAGRIEGVTISEVSRGNANRWEIQFDILIDKRTFVYEVADRGTMRRAMPGVDQDNYGQTIPSGFIGVLLRPIMQDGRIITEPVYLDGDGSPLPADRGYRPFYGKWRNEVEMNWLDCPYLQTVINAV